MAHIVEHGIQVLIPPDAGNRKSPRPGWDGGLYAFMRRVLQTDRGGELYPKRKGMIEPVFAHTKFNRGSIASNAEAVGRAVGMATDHRHTQPPEAPPPPAGHRRARRTPGARLSKRP